MATARELVETSHHLTESSVGEDPRPRRTRWLILTCLLLALAAVMAARSGQKSPASSKPEPVTAPQQKALAAIDAGAVFARGRLEPLGQVRAVAPAGSAGGSTVVELRVKEGDTVKRGQVLAVLDGIDRLGAACEAALARLQEAEARADLEAVEVQAARRERAAVLGSAESRLELARTKLERRQAMDERATTLEDIDDARLEVSAAEFAVEEARARLERYEHTGTGSQLDVAAREAEVSARRAEVRQAEEELEAVHVRAPVDGEILQVLVREGERIDGSALLEMGATDRMYARMEVYESDVRRIVIGGRVEITSPALSGPLMGRVQQIASFVRQQSVVDATPAANTDARVMDVLVELGNDASATASRFVSLQVRGSFSSGVTR
ncbi:MAG: efflux RND transporter periplasmic adaptor subunit [Planctomycetota bacterium]